MDIELVHDKVPFGHSRFGFNSALNMIDVILFGTGGPHRGETDVAGRHIKIDDKGQGAVSNVFKFSSFHFAGA